MSYIILLATNNKHKLQEVNEILGPHDIKVVSPKEMGIDPGDPIENGVNYYENALIKASNLARFTNLPVIADDSGLEVEAMDNKPGLHSARFADECGGHDKAIEYILNFLKDKDNRKARFVCDIVLVNVNEKPLLFEGIAPGTIGTEAIGRGGFGYDPIFISDETKKGYGAMTQEEKNQVSHRTKALNKLVDYLRLDGLVKK